MRSHPGHSISTLTTFSVNVKPPEQAPQVSSIGRSSVPATRIVWQCGQGIFSSIRASIVGW